MSVSVGIADYGMGNLNSVAHALESLGATVSICTGPRDLQRADRVVLPGVGAFGDAMENLRRDGWVDALHENVRERQKPFLGICLGLQLIATSSTEHGVHEGLGWIDGHVENMGVEAADLRIPHIGWNDVRVHKADGLYTDIGAEETFYFVHSFALPSTDPSVVSGTCTYGTDFVASVEAGNVFATQFHPEKSHLAGLTVLRNFLRV